MNKFKIRKDDRFKRIGWCGFHVRIRVIAVVAVVDDTWVVVQRPTSYLHLRKPFVFLLEDLSTRWNSQKDNRNEAIH